MRNYNPERIAPDGLRSNARAIGEYTEDRLNKLHWHIFFGPNASGYASRFLVWSFPPGLQTISYCEVLRIPEKWIPGGNFKVSIWYGGSAVSANNYQVNIFIVAQRDGGIASADSHTIVFRDITLAGLTVPNEVIRHDLYTRGSLNPADRIVGVRFTRNVDTNPSDLFVMLLTAEYFEPSVESG